MFSHLSNDPLTNEKVQRLTTGLGHSPHCRAAAWGSQVQENISLGPACRINVIVFTHRENKLSIKSWQGRIILTAGKAKNETPIKVKVPASRRPGHVFGVLSP